ncbi:MAG: N-acetylmuramoyl-L-alanine amidase family protein [Clostridiales bacterium]|jgi:N-acetylmuramoyl-L-alanine amidase|nr:N-acetylmuramoyl-L-alanine amidase family protein [Eubacteriales bacterium]MDH7565857.1 N-acetylmuramoyl-L-alanine amidase family protein [Clostridiales bacterium]
MKKIAMAVLCVLVLSLFSVDAFSKDLLLTYDGKTLKYTGKIYTLKINDETVSTDVPPVIINSRSMVPVRAVFEKLGATVNWNASTRKMSVKYNNMSIEFKENDATAKLNGSPVKMDAAARMVNNRLTIPVSFMDKQMNMSVGWFPKEGLITIDTVKNTLKDVQFSSSGEKDLVTLSMDSYKGSNVLRLTKPDRIVIDIPGTQAPDKETKIETKGNFVNAVRYARYNGNNARVVLDLNGQAQYQVEEKADQLVISVEKPTYENIVYDNSSDRVFFSLKGVKLTEGDEDMKKLYTGKFDEKGTKYTITFPSTQGEIGTGVFKINDSLLDTVEIEKDEKAGTTRMVFNAKDKFFYEIITRPQTNDTAICILKPASRKDKLVVIDAGHGGVEPGAIYGGIYEKDLNLDIALRLNALLKGKNIKTYMIRSDDIYVGLYERAYIANDLNAALFLSIHNNALDNPDYGGTMTLFNPVTPQNNSLTNNRFAQIIQENLVGKLKTTNRKLSERPKLVVLKATKMTASLAEVAFMTNKKDMGNLKTDSFRQNAAAALCNAIEQALREIK